MKYLNECVQMSDKKNNKNVMIGTYEKEVKRAVTLYKYVVYLIFISQHKIVFLLSDGFPCIVIDDPLL